MVRFRSVPCGRRRSNRSVRPFWEGDDAIRIGLDRRRNGTKERVDFDDHLFVVPDPQVSAGVVAEEFGVRYLRRRVLRTGEGSEQIVAHADHKGGRDDLFKRETRQRARDALFIEKSAQASADRQDAVEDAVDAQLLIFGCGADDFRRRGEYEPNKRGPRELPREPECEIRADDRHQHLFRARG